MQLRGACTARTQLLCAAGVSHLLTKNMERCLLVHASQEKGGKRLGQTDDEGPQGAFTSCTSTPGTSGCAGQLS